jgi:phosphopantetheinyl transferase (holo-ACP synthase)
MYEPELTVWLAGPAARLRFDAGAQTPEDRERWQQIVNPGRREEWEVSRALLSHVRSGFGVAAPDARVSLSHSGGFAAVAASRMALRVGVDLECERERDVVRLARFAFSEHECVQLEALPVDARVARFYFLWTLKEAFAKALTLPLMASLARCTFATDENGEWHGTVPTGDAWIARVFRPATALTLSVVALLPANVPHGNFSVLAHEWPEERAGSWRSLATLRDGSE